MSAPRPLPLLPARYSSTGFLGSLPDLRQKRYGHACGSFTTSQGDTVRPPPSSLSAALVLPVTIPPCPLHTQVLLVTGGYDGGYLSSTELLPLSSPTAWTVAASLPRAVRGLRAASLPGGLYFAGGWDGSSYRDEVRTPLTLHVSNGNFPLNKMISL